MRPGAGVSLTRRRALQMLGGADGNVTFTTIFLPVGV